MNIIFTRTNTAVRIPQYSSTEAAGLDFFNLSDAYDLQPRETKIFSTGIKMKLPKGYFLFLQTRSSMAIKGLQVVGGVIDSDYLGEISVVLCNRGEEVQKIVKDTKICQGILLECGQATMIELDDYQFKHSFHTERGTGGFGSTN
jgi:dUTP pyrophosphatase